MPKKSVHFEGLDELFNYCPPEDHLWRKPTVERILAGDDAWEFRVPAADTGAEVFFNTREILARFTALCKPDQEAFLRSIRAAMKKEGVDEIYLTVKWSAAKKRVIHIREINVDGGLNIYV